jgi:hypothetical protein
VERCRGNEQEALGRLRAAEAAKQEAAARADGLAKDKAAAQQAGAVLQQRLERLQLQLADLQVGGQLPRPLQASGRRALLGSRRSACCRRLLPSVMCWRGGGALRPVRAGRRALTQARPGPAATRALRRPAARRGCRTCSATCCASSNAPTRPPARSRLPRRGSRTPTWQVRGDRRGHALPIQQQLPPLLACPGSTRQQQARRPPPTAHCPLPTVQAARGWTRPPPTSCCTRRASRSWRASCSSCAPAAA